MKLASAALIDTVESVANSSIGVLVSVAAVLLLWPAFGWEATPAQSLAVTGIFWLLSTARSFAIRRFFRWLS